MKNRIVFDLDGTIYPLYHQENWLERLLSEEKGLFNSQGFMGHFPTVLALLKYLKAHGHAVSVCTWTPKNVSDKYIAQVEREKIEWLEDFFGLDFFDSVFVLPYGADKKAPFKSETGVILFDDNSEIRQEWNEGDGFVSFDETQILPVLNLLANAV